MRGWLYVPYQLPRDDRPDDYAADVEFTETIVEHFLTEFTEPGDVVLDPFLGFGTTIAVAARMGRRGIGVELLPDRAQWVRERLGDRATVLTGDARALRALESGPVDFSMTSPPYMTRENHPENALDAYRTNDGNYDRYLADLHDVYTQLAELLRPGGFAVVNVANIRFGGADITTL